jgi:hypothetical protein
MNHNAVRFWMKSRGLSKKTQTLRVVKGRIVSHCGGTSDPQITLAESSCLLREDENRTPILSRCLMVFHSTA